MRGLIWAAAKLNPPWLVSVLCGIVETDRPSRFVVDRKLLNAAYDALGYANRPEATSALERLRAGTRDRGYLKQIDRALESTRPALRRVK